MWCKPTLKPVAHSFNIIVFEFYRRFGYNCLFFLDYVFACVYLLDYIHFLYGLDNT